MNHYTHPQHHHHSALQMIIESGCGDIGNGTGGGGGSASIQSQLMINNTGQSGHRLTMTENPINGSYHAHHPSANQQSSSTVQQQSQQTISFDHSQQTQQAQNHSQLQPQSQPPGQHQQTHEQQFDSGGQSYPLYIQYHSNDSANDLSQQYNDHSWNKPQHQAIQSAQMINQYDQSWNNTWNPAQQQQGQPQQYQQHSAIFTGQLEQISYHPDMMISQTQSQQQVPPAPQQQASLTPSTVNEVVLQAATPPKKQTTKRKKTEPGTKEGKIPTAYALFFRDTQPQIKQEFPRANFGEISKIVSKRWEQLDVGHKENYKERANFEKKNLRLNAASTKAKQLASTQEITIDPQQQQQQILQTLPSASSLMSQRTTTQMQAHHDSTIQFLNQYPAQVQQNQFLDQHSQMQPFSQDSLYINHQMVSDTGGLNNSFDPLSGTSQVLSAQYVTTQQHSSQVAPTTMEYSQDSNSLHSNTHDTLGYEDPLASLLDFDDDNFDFMSDFSAIPVDTDFNGLMNDELSGESFISAGLGVSTPTGGTLGGLNEDSQLSNQATSTLLSSSVPMITQIHQQQQPIQTNLSQMNEQLHHQTLVMTHQNLSVESLLINQQKTPENGQLHLISERYCSRDGCNKPAIECKQWSASFCSEECCMKHCENVFSRWRKDRVTSATSVPGNTGLRSTNDNIDISNAGINSNNSQSTNATNLNLVVS